MIVLCEPKENNFSLELLNMKQRAHLVRIQLSRVRISDRMACLKGAVIRLN